MLDQIFKIEISASVVGWYGAIMATISTVVAVFNYLRDRPKIDIKYQGELKITGGEAIYDPQKTYFCITVINKGRRPIRIDRVGFRIVGSEKPWLLVGDSFTPFKNKILTEENPTIDFLCPEDSIDFSKVWYIAVYDVTGQEYKKYFRNFPTLWRMFYWFKYRK